MSKGIGIIAKLRYFVNKECLLKIYHSFVQSHINYNILNWSCANPTSLQKLSLNVKKSVRLISFKNKYYHSAPLFNDLNILSLNQQIKYATGKFMWKLSNGYIKEPLSTFFCRNSYNPFRYNPSNPKSEYCKLLPSYSFTTNWNAIPQDVKCVTTFNSFRSRYKSYLIKSNQTIQNNHS